MLMIWSAESHSLKLKLQPSSELRKPFREVAECLQPKPSVHDNKTCMSRNLHINYQMESISAFVAAFFFNQISCSRLLYLFSFEPYPTMQGNQHHKNDLLVCWFPHFTETNIRDLFVHISFHKFQDDEVSKKTIGGKNP